ncbi:nitrate- and nitrite sensing domain-containing protein [Streptomyces sp. APSN-46.1]|uniref:sensor histidine kinase n=1 Tax=Streptomyces sp. APSN-46.1 TaxID=2929049 RepID=UPI001FB42656|nr:nitrate- and nitrite sensing domain-containing protein [Streptomyces sp. APSN-46.1]MCJ1680748.1 nitrate- and nitrite sensing domain-containing protein [Streptomyces sp. APSN-46.1]
MRSRLVVGVAVAGLTVLAAGSPAVVSAMTELNDSQRLVTLAEQTGQTLTLAHLLGDERDAVVEYAAKGRPGAGKAAVQERISRTDRQLAEVRAEADEELARALGRVQAVRAEAVDGKGGALAAHQAYAGVIAELLAPGDRLAELTPPRAGTALATTRPLAPLGQAVEQASATRGLLLAALAVPRGEQLPNSAVVDELTTAAQRSRVREQAALDEFNRASRPEVRQTLAATVTGPEVKTADDYLSRLTDRPTLSAADRKLDGAAVGSALTARIDRMRSVESTLAGQRATALAALRDDDVTALEALIAALGVLFLIAVGVSTAVARSLTRPLSVLRRGAARLATPEGSVEPVRFTGRNDEFAEVVRHLNAVRDQTVSLHTRIAGLDADRRRLIGRNEALASGREALEAELKQLRAGLEEHRRIMSSTSVSLSLRTLGLVERQLTVIEELESKEQDPDRLATLFRLDHLATVMRRHNENLLVLAGQEHGPGAGGPVPLVDVMRAAVSEIERYERVELVALPSITQVAGHAADDISHVLAELLENATTFSPPEARVKVSGWLMDSGDAVLSVADEGIGVTAERLASLNSRLSTPEAYDEEPESEHGLGLGLYVAGRLAARHGVTAELRGGRHGGTEALVVVPAALLPAAPPVSPVHTLATPGAPALVLPGVIAEANENTLPWGRLADAGSPSAALADAGSPSADEQLLARVVPTPEPPPTNAGSTTPADLPPAGAVFTVPARDAERPSAGVEFTVPAVDAELPPADAGFTVPAVDVELPSADQVFTVPARYADRTSAGVEFTVPAVDAELPPADAGFMVAARGAELPSADQVLTAPARDAELPSADAVFTAGAPASGAELSAPVVTGAAPADGAELPPGDEAFTVPGAATAADAVSADAGAGSAEEAVTAPAAPAGRGIAGQAPEGTRRPVPLHEAGPLVAVPDETPQPQRQRQPQAPAEPGSSPEGHGRAADAHGSWLPRQGSHPDEGVTDKGLPKRTPRAVPAPRADAVHPEPEPPRRVDADELRRRLGGFYRGAQDGRRVVAAELAQEQEQEQVHEQAHEQGTDQGDSAQEART